MPIMKIEVGKTYEINAYFKKSMFEIEQFKNEETGQMLNTEIVWRNGTFFVKVMNEEEAEELQNCLYIEGEQEEPEIWDFESYEACEMDSTFDGCAEDFVFYGTYFTEEEQDQLNEDYDEQLDSDDWVSRYEFLEERGFDSWGCNWQVHGGIEAVESDHEVYV
jgi:hypothetical protein